MSVNRRTFLKFGTALTAGAFIEPILTPISQAVSQVTSPDITHGSRSTKKIALTFHGAGPLAYANSLLDIFVSTSTPVTVFAIGSWLKANPTMAKKIIDGGHDIGNHTMNHYHMKTLNAAKVKSEIAGCAAELKSLIGNHGAFFRPSGTQYSTALIRQTALKYGYSQCISYDVDSHDYQDPGKVAVIKNVMQNIKGGSIVSLHFGHKNTVEALPTLITELHNAGYTPVTVTQLVGKL
jgi:peptidoglycan/xylan/chitin deacetylase (PgdA/CDA1 family)